MRLDDIQSSALRVPYQALTPGNNYATPGRVYITPGRAGTTGTPGGLSIGSQSSALISNVPRPKRGNLVVRLNRARNLKSQEFLQNPNPYVVFVYGKKRFESSVKYNNIGPVFNEEFVFEDVYYPPPHRSSLAFAVNYRFNEKNNGEGSRAKSGVLGVFDVSHVMWSKGPQSPRDTWIPISTKEGTYGGELNLSITWYQTEITYRIPFRVMAEVAIWPRSVTKVFDSPTSKVCDIILVILSSINQYIPVKIALPLVGISTVLTGMATLPILLIFLPVFLFLSIPFFMFTVLFFPIFFILMWITVSQESFETKIASPLLSCLLKQAAIRKILTVDM